MMENFKQIRSPFRVRISRFAFFLTCLTYMQSISSWIIDVPTTLKHNARFITRIDATAGSIRGVAAAGLDVDELKTLQQAFVFACQQQLVEFTFNYDDMILFPPACEIIPGSTGRVLLLQAQNLPEDEIEDLKIAISEEIDEIFYAQPPSLSQPILLSLEQQIPPLQKDYQPYLQKLVARHVQTYELATPLARRSESKDNDRIVLPSKHVEVDGAVVTSTTGEESWDTSSLLVFDNFVNDDLRERILQVINDNKDWDDVKNGPDPNRWVRGGLMDLPGQEQQQDDTVQQCYGLTDDAIDDLCLHHDAFEEFETIISDRFPDFTVCRLPEAALGSSISPLTANAPTHGDFFSYHIDADPNLMPPSPWTDIFGQYPNRQAGKPRFVSCLLYLNEEWKGESWGAPTRFLDVQSDTHYDVLPVPGRCVFMDQDITHTVVPPTVEAGHRPRYSLVWKLILHPKNQNQNMKQLFISDDTKKRQWPVPVLLGSAKMTEEANTTRTLEGC